MEKELVWKMVQGQIGYDFKNLAILLFLILKKKKLLNMLL